MNDIIAHQYILKNGIGSLKKLKKSCRKIDGIRKNFGWKDLCYINDIYFYCSVYNWDRIKIKSFPKREIILKNMEINYSLKLNNLELSEDNLKIYEMLTYPCSYTENDFSHALKHQNHLKRNNVKINRFIV